MWLGQMISNSICLRVMENLDKSIVMQVPAVFGIPNKLTAEECSATRPFEHSSNHILQSQ